MPEPCIIVPIIYHHEWADGFGARGWKLEAAIDDPEVIAATSETGLRIPTSVLIHDILDHHLCGLPLSGHRNEAIALHQLSLRTGSDPRPDLIQMVDEDIMHGRVIGESMHAFLPEHLRARLPGGLTDDKDIAEHLIHHLGWEKLHQALTQHMANIGREGASEARNRYQSSGLDYARRSALGLAMQTLFERADALAEGADWEKGQGRFLLMNDDCELRIEVPQPLRFNMP
ncbi:MAG: hypothetical protein KJ946_00935 [Gammaproteobacteria bacterium]|nr:hypothetical protein [Gammaproteobacteria bacterium]